MLPSEAGTASLRCICFSCILFLNRFIIYFNEGMRNNPFSHPSPDGCRIELLGDAEAGPFPLSRPRDETSLGRGERQWTATNSPAWASLAKRKKTPHKTTHHASRRTKQAQGWHLGSETRLSYEFLLFLRTGMQMVIKNMQNRIPSRSPHLPLIPAPEPSLQGRSSIWNGLGGSVDFPSQSFLHGNRSDFCPTPAGRQSIQLYKTQFTAAGVRGSGRSRRVLLWEKCASS